MTIIGARPQFIKAATVTRALRKKPGITEFIVHTGQHYDYNMSDVFFEDLEINAPDINLGIGSGSHGRQTGRMIEALESIMLDKKPEIVLVYGDTNSTLAGALAAVKLHIPIAHVEAGLRSFNRQMPEEINRVITDTISTMLFAPTVTAVENLKNENISAASIYQVGDVMYDAALYYGKKAEQKSRIIQQLNIQNDRYILATIHRAENTDNIKRLKNIFDTLNQIAKNKTVILPLHPRTAAILGKQNMIDRYAMHIHMIDPVGYLDMVMLEKNAELIITDSGGIQKESFFYQVPCVTLRDETEWVELVQVGWNHLASPEDKNSMLQTINESIESKGEEVSLYGDGHAVEKIVRSLCEL